MTAPPPGDLPLTAEDRRRLAALGIGDDEVRRQLALFADPPPPARLVRPCRVGDGIRTFAAGDEGRLIARAETAAREGRLAKFVPASGAATRMFAGAVTWLGRVAGSGEEIPRAAVAAAAGQGDAAAAEVLELVDRLAELAFAPDLAAAMAVSGLDLDDCRRRGDVRPILEHLLTPAGLDFAALAKGLIPFHRYPQGNRTAFEEHLVEGREYAADEGERCRFHFTVPPEDEEHFQARLATARRRLGGGATFEVAFSHQEHATDTLAVTPDGLPFRLADGSLHLRPGGHGALLGNLEGSGGDVVFIKNVDNVLPDRLRPPTVRWKKLLAGLLLEVQDAAFSHLARLDEADGAGGGAGEGEAVAAAARFAAEALAASPPGDLGGDGLRRWLRDRLDRPLRVCAMVENRGEPGGGPFWVEGADGAVSPQIVERAQIDDTAPDQARLLAAATHFNPVDLVCGLRDRRGRPYELARFVDPATAFIAEKTLEGRRLLALERPGLWNGAMAGWNSLFVEVPAATFAPVKTVLDLLRPEHRR